MLNYKDIFENNKKWVEKKTKSNPLIFNELSQNHDPDFLLITCCDSRVAPLQMIGAEPGDVFIHRNIGNIVNHKDPNCMSAIEFAVQSLGVKHIIVCGHYFCGAIIAANQKEKLDVIDPWIKPIRDVIDLNKSSLLAIQDDTARHKALVEKHVLMQCKNVVSSPSYQKAIKKKLSLVVHAWVLDLSSGKVIDLNFKG